MAENETPCPLCGQPWHDPAPVGTVTHIQRYFPDGMMNHKSHPDPRAEKPKDPHFRWSEEST